MFGRLFDNPMVVIMILLVIVLLFGAPKLPGMARSLGQSMRIFKSEVREMKDDDKDSTVVDGETVDSDSTGSTSTSANSAGTTNAQRTNSTGAPDTDGTAH